MTGGVLPDEACGRQDRAYMKKEKKCGLPELVQCFTQKDFDKWSEKYNISQVDCIKEGGKHSKRSKRVVFSNPKKDE